MVLKKYNGLSNNIILISHYYFIFIFYFSSDTKKVNSNSEITLKLMEEETKHLDKAIIHILMKIIMINSKLYQMNYILMI